MARDLTKAQLLDEDIVTTRAMINAWRERACPDTTAARLTRIDLQIAQLHAERALVLEKHAEAPGQLRLLEAKLQAKLKERAASPAGVQHKIKQVTNLAADIERIVAQLRSNPEVANNPEVAEALKALGLADLLTSSNS